MTITIVWLRRDLRLADHPALWEASQEGVVIPLYILDADEQAGAAELWWRHHSLQQLQESLARYGLPLILRRGKPLQILQEIIAETSARAVFWNRRYDPAGIAQDTAIKAELRSQGIAVRSFTGDCLVEPWLHHHDEKPYKVFTPFWKSLLARFSIAPALPEPDFSALPHQLTQDLVTETLAEWHLLPQKPNWAKRFSEFWAPGETGAKNRLQQFLDESLVNYSEGRNFPAQNSVSRLSPHLSHGEISPRQIWQETRFHLRQHPELTDEGEHFLRELGWREFSWHLLFHFPQLPDTPLRPEFADFPWQKDALLLERWQSGQTGYPIVDAGMRELWQSGWMHNRVRMICASFLIKDLLVSWQEGEAWFWDTLVDADLANNSASWQWVAGSGADAAPYFRIFNPVLQGEKFDPEGKYLRRWIPELSALPDRFIHQPWAADQDLLKKAGVVLGGNYPKRLIDHHEARQQALDIFEKLKKNNLAKSDNL
ncbi:cryptochrome/photolyase family protein [Acidithiobacillus albertensis]|uniref:cryptochrome/photolyase family protein n=1 Tax=Acidithiobacillus albertensis TaxID=119978 RepID=UPI00094B14AE|nr:deoxyribodipyrimidine photo-lyase [Acidithiobacillus albertensis]